MLGESIILCNQKRLHLRARAQLKFLVLFMLLALCSFSTLAGQLTAVLKDSATGEYLVGHKVIAYQLDETNRKKWRASKYSDDNGQVSFELEGLGEGGRFILAASVYNGFKVYTSEILEPGEQSLVFGSTRIQVINGTVTEKSPLVDSKVHIYTLNAEDKSWFAAAYTDDAGMLKVDLPNIDSGQQYLLGIASPISGQRKYSSLTASGDHQFIVGNLPLSVSLVDGVSGSPFIAQRVDVYYYDVDGTKRWYTRAESNEQGLLRFDLEGLGSGRQYVLRTKVFNNLATFSDRLSEPGDYQFKVGTSTMEVLNGTVSPNTPLANQRVDFHRLMSDGSKQYFARAYSDDNGIIRLNLPGLEQGQSYSARSKSPIDGKTYYYQTITSKGTVKLVIGSIPLRVTLQDALTKALLVNKEISAYTILSDGKKQRVAKAMTDGSGMVTFDLAEIDNGKQYYLTVKAFGDYKSYSPMLNASGDFLFEVGTSRITLKDGSLPNQPLMAGAALGIHKIDAEGKRRWFGSVTTDANGRARMDLPGLGEGTIYGFRALSTINGSKKYSEPLTQPGDFSFVVGNPAVSVRLFNILSGEAYANEKLHAFWVDDAGKRQWYSRQVTDENGRALFDLEDIAQGKAYGFKVSKFSTGASYSQMISSPGHVEMGIGAVPMTLSDKESGTVLSDVKVHAYKIGNDGSLQWVASGRSDSAGQLTFDLPDLHFGTRHTFKAKSPFGEGKRYYGPVITNIGAVNFAMTKGQFGQLDLQAPEVLIDTPEGNDANSAGFTVAGIAIDDQAIEGVDVIINGNVLNTTYDLNTSRWSADVPATMVSGMTAVTIAAIAYDVAQNSTGVSRSYNIIDDAAPPMVAIASHQNGDQVNVVGFTVIGTVSDDVGVASITATLNDPLLGETISAQPLNISTSTGQWALPVTNGRVSSDQSIQITLTATDFNGKTTDASLTLNTFAAATNPLQLAQRITFGLTPQLLARVKQGDDYLNEQLNPDSIDDSEFEAQMAARTVTERQQLRDYLLDYMTGSQKQLREVMAWFWENHFSTNINAHGSVAFEFNENQLFRQHALGRFRDLLEASAKSAAMIVYLNNAQNVAGRANENYAREIMELHTMGVDGGYSAEDIAELSRIFTGWHQNEGAFFFNDALHDNGEKVFLGQTIVGSGVAEGEQVLDILSSHPSTASFICSKLVTLFVSDQPVSTLQAQCAAEFLASDGDITAVLRVIFGSDAFAASDNYRSKLKTPLEWVTTSIRGFGVNPSVNDVDEALREMGMRLFEFPAPTGFSEVAVDWLNSNAVLQRLRLAHDLANIADIRALLTSQGFSSAEAIVSYLFELALGGEFSELEYQLALSILNDNQPFDFNGNDADTKLTRLLGTVLSFPGYQYQ